MHAERPPDSSGSIRVRIRYAECDPMGVAHHASYLAWLEIGRTELLRTSGVTYSAMEAAGFFLVITRCELRYRRPLRYDDMVEVRTRVESAGRVKIRHSYEVSLVERHGKTPADAGLPPDAVCAVATTELACVGSDARPRELPAWLTGR